MQIKISYQEVQEAVAKKFKQCIELCYVDTSTFNVNYTIKIFGHSKSIGVNLKVDRIEESDIYMSYSGGLGIELVVSPFLSFMKRLLPESTGFIQEQGNQIVKIRLSEISQMEKILEKVKLERISFDNEGTIINAVMK